MQCPVYRRWRILALHADGCMPRNLVASGYMQVNDTPIDISSAWKIFMVTATVGDGRPSIPVIAQSGDTPCYEARQSIPIWRGTRSRVRRRAFYWFRTSQSTAEVALSALHLSQNLPVLRYDGSQMFNTLLRIPHNLPVVGYFSLRACCLSGVHSFP